ncbi:MAG: Type I restriction-modification system, DNA adenine N6-methyltransferase subunit [Candidatus Adlerbacteria bacterium GW2011_GWC1_50_9]|uniref:Type I restriction-modification system, DNA adenine N6-methyltransferase subunit n=1 Tax=Candidatus Adlerbacteria bacterium GW2011_GWC1_50_9 TaxID=1618608 RepID=A0A0G1WJE2_9BACT|nr:MAG: Type I restriction-modification system, DNA adenine N6-methyltransferase subunit [Candidatus Adlerbacteria bacterium GW2011_GWC1_50_9]
MQLKGKKYLTVKEAAIFLGVSPQTVRSWDEKRKLTAARGKSNRYRLYLISELQKFKENHKARKYNRKPTL